MKHNEVHQYRCYSAALLHRIITKTLPSKPTIPWLQGHSELWLLEGDANCCSVTYLMLWSLGTTNNSSLRSPASPHVRLHVCSLCSRHLRPFANQFHTNLLCSCIFALPFTYISGLKLDQFP